MKTVFTLITMVCVLSGCTAFETAAAPKIAKGVQQYCLQPKDTRMLLRAEVAKLAAPNSVQVNCAVDVETPTD